MRVRRVVAQSFKTNLLELFMWLEQPSQHLVVE
jgi:hypothetical protein